MSISRRTAIAVRTIGVASAAAALALGVAGNAFACNISEFSATASCTNGKGSIDVLDKDNSGTLVTITVSQGDTPVGDKSGVQGTREGVTVNFPVDWKPNTTYTVHVVKDKGHEVVGDTTAVTGSDACAVATTPPVSDSPSPSASPTVSESAPPATTPPTAAPTSSAAVVADTNAPSPAAGGTTDLAETGGGSNTGMIAGIAGALVVVGGGAVFGLRRRTAGARH